MASITIKNLDPELLERLRAQARKRDLSMNALVQALLARWLGLEGGVEVHSDLADLAGSWSEEDEQDFLESVKPLREIDENLWR